MAEPAPAEGALIPTTAPVGVPAIATPTPFGVPRSSTAPGAPAQVGFDAAPAPEPSSEAQAAGPSTVEPSGEAPAPDATSGPPVELTDAPDTSADLDQPAAPATATPVPASTAAPSPTAEPIPEPPPAETPLERTVIDVGYRPLGEASGVTLLLPVARIELIGFHEAGHPGSQAINAAGTGVSIMTLESRGRGTASRSAADIVVPPGEPVVAPVTGTVVASSGYILYCQYDDQLVYIEPDGLPGWQVRLFHVEGSAPPVGTRVVAGETVIASSARLLPFESQIDEHTSEPSWPHVHIEVVDTSVPDTRPPGPGCP